jgi:hypothetical protein
MENIMGLSKNLKVKLPYNPENLYIFINIKYI